jgi:hypothetical protein
LRVDVQESHPRSRVKGLVEVKKLKLDGVDCKTIVDENDSPRTVTPEAFEDLERQLAESQAELDQYQGLLN